MDGELDAGPSRDDESDNTHESPLFTSISRQKFTSRLRAIVDILQGVDFDIEQYNPTIHRPLVEFEPPDGQEEVTRYWVNAPFAFVSICHDRSENQHFYHVVEPTLEEDEATLLEVLIDDIRDPLVYGTAIGTEDFADHLRQTLVDQLSQYGIVFDTPSVAKLFYYLFRTFRGFGKIDPIMYDPRVEDISCDGYNRPIFVYHQEFADLETNVTFNREALDSFVVKLAQQSGRHISVGEPIIEASLPDGSRAELALGEEVTPHGSAFTIRKYSMEPFTPIDLYYSGTYNLRQLAYLWLAIENNMSLIFAGGTASGKTTSMNAMSMFIPPRSKVITIEDTKELTLHHQNWLSSITRERIHGGANISMYDLLRSGLRHRPEYIIVGEVRGKEAITLFQAMNTGHTTYSTLHADSVQTVINRLENEPINVPRAMIESLDILVVQVLTRANGERVRRANVVAEIGGLDPRTGDLDYSTAWRWDSQNDDFQDKGATKLEEIRRRRGWTQEGIRAEVADRHDFLAAMVEEDITDYRRFTTLINEYYANPSMAMDRLGLTRRHSREGTSS